MGPAGLTGSVGPARGPAPAEEPRHFKLCNYSPGINDNDGHVTRVGVGPGFGIDTKLGEGWSGLLEKVNAPSWIPNGARRSGGSSGGEPRWEVKADLLAIPATPTSPGLRKSCLRRSALRTTLETEEANHRRSPVHAFATGAKHGQLADLEFRRRARCEDRILLPGSPACCMTLRRSALRRLLQQISWGVVLVVVAAQKPGPRGPATCATPHVAAASS